MQCFGVMSTLFWLLSKVCAQRHEGVNLTYCPAYIDNKVKSSCLSRIQTLGQCNILVRSLRRKALGLRDLSLSPSLYSSLYFAATQGSTLAQGTRVWEWRATRACGDFYGGL